MYDGCVIAEKVVILLQRLHRHDDRLGYKHRQRSTKTLQIAQLERLDYFYLFLTQHGHMDHFADHDIHRFGRQVIKGVGVDHFHFAAVRIECEKAARLRHQFRIKFDAPDFACLGRCHAGEYAGSAAKLEHFCASENNMLNRRLEVAHAVLVLQHIVVIMQGDELPENVTAGFILAQDGILLDGIAKHMIEMGFHFASA